MISDGSDEDFLSNASDENFLSDGSENDVQIGTETSDALVLAARPNGTEDEEIL